MGALQRAENDRIIAQARKIVPAIFPADLFGENMWTVKVSNTSNGVVTHLAVSVTAVDAHGNEIPGGCPQASDQMVIGDAFRRLISDALGGRDRVNAYVVKRDALSACSTGGVERRSRRERQRQQRF